jgi:hypothetical protein
MPVWLQTDDYDMPPFNGETLSAVLPTAITITAVALVESLMTVRKKSSVSSHIIATPCPCFSPQYISNFPDGNKMKYDLPTYLPTYLPACLPAYPPAYLPTCLPTYY